MDGRSLLPVAKAPGVVSGRALLIEKGAVNSEGEPIDATGYSGIRTPQFKYVEYGTGEKELYNLSSDPYEERSLHAKPGYDAMEAVLARRLAHLRTCSGTSCLAP
jgi:N-acetylglucosamine-6-sulfatase